MTDKASSEYKSQMKRWTAQFETSSRVAGLHLENGGWGGEGGGKMTAENNLGGFDVCRVGRHTAH